jgi:hypothetical protein
MFAAVVSMLFVMGLFQTPAFADAPDHLYQTPSGPPVDTMVETWLETNTSSIPLSFSPFDMRNSVENREQASNSFDTVLGICSAQVSNGCIESIRYSTDGLTWYTASLARTLQQRHMAYGRYTGVGDFPWDMQLTSTWPADPALGLFASSLPNEFSLPNAPHALGADYLINATVTSRLVNGVASMQGLEIEAIAGSINGDSAFDCDYWHVENANVTPQASYCYETLDLPANLQLEVNVQLGNRISELSGWFDGRLANPTIGFGSATSPGLVTIKGSPLKVNYFETNPIPKGHPLFTVPDEINEMQKRGGTGTRGGSSPRDGLESFLRLESFVPNASAEVDTVWKISSWTRDVGIDECASNPGIQGIIITNATTYSPNPPAFDAQTGELNFRVASTHYLPDGVTLNRGYYKLILQEKLADCLWGAGNAAAASISVKENSGAANIADTSIQTMNGWVTFTATNFHFSAPEITVGFKRPTRVAANTPAASPITQTPTTALPATIKAKKSIKVNAKSSAGLPVKVKVKGSCTVKSNMKTTVKKVGKKKVKTKSVVSYSVKLGKKGKTCTVTQTSPSNGSVAAMNSVSVIKIR